MYYLLNYVICCHFAQNVHEEMAKFWMILLAAQLEVDDLPLL